MDIEVTPEVERPLLARATLPRVSGRRAARSFASAPPWRVAVLVALVYAAFVAGALVHHSAGDFAFVGRTFVARSGTTAAIAEHAQPTSHDGYDGQFALFIALDPAHAAPSIDKPAYRYTHILYPALARALAFGNDAWVPAAMILVNLLSVFFGTFALALILKRDGQPTALAALFGFFPGVFVAFERDLGDLLAYALVAVAVLALRWDVRNRIVLAGLAFAFAGLARESTLLFPAVLALLHTIQPGIGRRAARLRRSAVLAVLAAAPYVAWKLFLLAWLGASHSVPSGLAPFPLAGIVLQRPWDASALLNLLTVVVPGVLLLLVALRAGLVRRPSPFLVVLGIQLFVFVALLPVASYFDYYAAGRLQIGAVVAASCCTPSLRSLARPFRSILVVGAGLAMLPGLFFALVVAGGALV